jgi:phosphosulfolactate synthase (CoM biosynthesis protein A)
MDLLNVLSKLTAIETGVVAEEGTKVSHEKATGSNSDIENVLRGLMSIQEESSAKLDEEDMEEGNEFSGALAKAKAAGAKEFEVDGKKYQVDESATRELTDADNKVLAMIKKEIREMEQALATAPSEDRGYYEYRLNDLHGMVRMIHGKEPYGLDTDVMDEVSDMYRSIGASMYESGSRVKEAVEQLEECGEMEMPTAEEMPAAPMYTLNIRNGASNLSMTTSAPEEIVAIMKLAGLNGSAEVSQHAPVEEEFANTPAQTNERTPRLHGDIADWGMKGTANAKTHYTPASQGDNPLGEENMMEQYKKFKQSK